MGRKTVADWLKPNYNKEDSGFQKKINKIETEKKIAILREQAQKIFVKSNAPACALSVNGKNKSSASAGSNTTNQQISSDNIQNPDEPKPSCSKSEKEKDLAINENHQLESELSNIPESKIETDYEELNKLEDKQNCMSEPLDASDPTLWPEILTEFIRTSLLLQGPVQKKLVTQTKESRNFSNKYFTGLKPNGEIFHREWLLFSEKQNSLFCFPCCIFREHNVSVPWSHYGANGKGFQDFHNTLRGITKHEESLNHIENSRRWKLFVYDHKKGRHINSANEEILKKEEKSWKAVLKGILEAILFLAENNLAFRGSTGSIGEYGCGNFLNLISLLSKFYPPLTEHVMKLKKGQTNYLSPQIQNEFISLCGKHVKDQIVTNIKNRTYFSIMFDATPDVSHTEQISQIIRTVSCSPSGCFIHENFIDFISCDDKKGTDIADLIFKKLKTDNLEMRHCRGQSYDNGSNMAGKYKGVQKLITNEYPLATFVPCAAHSLNLVGVHAAEKVLPAKLILGHIQNVYNFFVRSPKRWTLMKTKLTCNLKGESKTRWSARSDAVSALSQQFEEVIEVFITIMSSSDFNSDTVANANSLFNTVFTFKFLLGITIWEHILFRIQVCNNTLQKDELDVDVAEKQLAGLLIWLKDFKKDGYKLCYDKAVSKAEAIDLDINTGFENVRTTRGRKRKRSGEQSEEAIIMSNEKRFEIEFFNSLLDSLISEMETRFIQLRDCCNKFSFLWGKRLSKMKPEEIENHVKQLCGIYENDFTLAQFVIEAQTLKSTIAPFFGTDVNWEKIGPLDVLNVIHKTDMLDSFCNVDVALRIFLTLPITIASNERAFSKLKILKNYLRCSMGQERLTNLAILSIEHEITKLIDFDIIISLFAEAKVRKVKI